MSICAYSGGKFFVASLAISLATMLAGCGGGGGGSATTGGEAIVPGTPAPTAPESPAPAPLALIFDSLGRPLQESEFGNGDANAAGADGIAFDSGAAANAEVVLADNAGTKRTTTTDAAGYYRFSIKDLAPPFVVSVRRSDGSHWQSASAGPVKARGFLTINISGLTDKVLSYAADSAGLGAGASIAVTPAVLAANGGALAAATAKLRAGLAIPLANAGLDAASFDPVTTPLQVTAADKHAAFLQRLALNKTGLNGAGDQGRTFVVAALAGAGAFPTNGAAIASTFSAPSGVAVDGAGNLFVADTNNHLIRKISADGGAATFAGSGSPGFTNLPGSAAAFNLPRGVAVDREGNVYVADTGNHAIRKITAAGVVTTLAGAGVAGFADGAGASAQFSQPRSLAVDAAGNVYVSDLMNSALRKITPAGDVTTVAGRRPGDPLFPSKGLTSPNGVAVDRDGNVYVAYYGDGQYNQNIRKITPSGAASDLYPFLSPAENTELANHWYPNGVAVDAAGNVYVTDETSNRVRKVSAGGTVSEIAGGQAYPWVAGLVDGRGADVRFSAPRGIAVDAGGTLFVADSGNNVIRKVVGFEVTTVAGKSAGFTDGTGEAATFDHPVGLAVDTAGNILVADTGNHAIRKISRAGAVTTVAGNGYAGNGDGKGRFASFDSPTGVGVDGRGNVYVASKSNLIRKVDTASEVSTFAGSVTAGFADGFAAAATFNAPTHLVADRDGNVYVSDTGNALIRKTSAAGVVTTLAGDPQGGFLRGDRVGPLSMQAGGGALYFEALCTSRPGQLRNSNCLFTIGAEGSVREVLRPATFYNHGGLAVDSRSNVFYLYQQQFGDPQPPYADRIFRLSPEGVETDAAADPRFNGARGMVVDANGNLVVADTNNSLIKLVLP